MFRILANLEKEGVTSEQAMQILKIAIEKKLDTNEVYSAVSPSFPPSPLTPLLQLYSASPFLRKFFIFLLPFSLISDRFWTMYLDLYHPLETAFVTLCFPRFGPRNSVSLYEVSIGARGIRSEGEGRGGREEERARGERELTYLLGCQSTFECDDPIEVRESFCSVTGNVKSRFETHLEAVSLIEG